MQKNSSDNKLVIKHSGFARSEVFEIKAKSLFEASKLLGKEVRKVAQLTLKHNLSLGNKKELLYRADRYLRAFQRIAIEGALTVNGVNYGQRYVEAFSGYAEGVGISLAEVVFLQAEIIAGCQTIYSRDSRSGEIRLVHTEENDDDNLINRKAYDYRLVKISLPEKQVTFFAYPGLCGWGPAFGINETNYFVQTVDDLLIRNKYPNANIWANAISFMFLDAGDFDVIKNLKKNLEKILSKSGCVNGYAAHMATNKMEPVMQSIEFGGKEIRFVGTDRYNNQKIIAQANYPRDEGVKKYSESHPPQNSGRWKVKEIRTHLEMSNRQERLIRFAKETKWPRGKAVNVINTGLKLLANPYGDLARYTDNSGNFKYYHTGLPSMWTAAHLVGYINWKEEHFYIGKLLPKPISSRKYSIKSDENYPYVEKRLWEKVEDVRREFYKKGRK